MKKDNKNERENYSLMKASWCMYIYMYSKDKEMDEMISYDII
jgi:hypothetical protein